MTRKKLCIVCDKKFYATDKKNNQKICGRCKLRYFTRKSGTELEGMDRTREFVRIRDKHTCQICGKIWKQGQRRFDIHHLRGMCGKKSRNYDKLKDVKNLITYCHRCHLTLDSVIRRMSRKSSPRPLKDKIRQQKWLQDNKPWLKL